MKKLVWTMTAVIMIVCSAGGCKKTSSSDSYLDGKAPVGPTTTLDVPGVYRTIQAAVDAAGSGDFVRVAAGVYTENVVIRNRNVGLRGISAAQTILIGRIEFYDNSETSLEAFTVKGGGVYAKNSGIRITGNAILEHAGPGLVLEKCFNSVISDNSISGNGREGVLLDDSTGAMGSNLVENNVGDGIAVNNASPTLLLNTVRGNARDGVSVRGFLNHLAAPILLDNRIEGNGGANNYDVICFGSNTNPTGSGNSFGKCINCVECGNLSQPSVHNE